MSDDTKPTEPREQVQRWAVEFEAAKKEVAKWHARGIKVVKRFRDERERGEAPESRWNLFSSNIQTQSALLYGQVPKVDVTRRFGDASDDAGRVAAQMLERALNCDIEAPTDTYAQALWHALQDRLLPGMGMTRIRYEREEASAELAEGEELPLDAEGNPVDAEPQLVSERVVVDYVPWRKHLWSPAETFNDVRWWAFAADLGREQLVQRFGEVGKLVPIRTSKRRKDSDEVDTKATPWGRAEVWEIWDKESKKVYWYVEDFSQLLDVKDDPLELEGFWPFPRPMTANATTDSLVPTPDFTLAQDQYNEIDELSTRIKSLEKAVNVRGAYDGQNDGLKRLLSEGADNDLIPVENFASFVEKGGIAGAIAWLPLETIIAALDKLCQQREGLVQALFQVTGMSDIMRGQAASSGVTATEQSIKAKFGSVRMQALQDEFARYASDIQRLKAEVMSKYFAPETMLERSNVMMTPDAPLAQQAVELIKSKHGLYRIEVKPESVSLADFAAQRNEATEFVVGVSQFLTAATPLAQAIPGSQSALMELLGLVMSRFRFAGEAEGIIDRALAQMKAQPPQQAAPQQDPKVMAAQLKAQTDMQRAALEHQADLARIQAETQAEVTKQRAQAQFNTQEELARSVIKVREAHAMPLKPVGGPLR